MMKTHCDICDTVIEKHLDMLMRTTVQVKDSDPRPANEEATKVKVELRVDLHAFVCQRKLEHICRDCVLEVFKKLVTQESRHAS